MDRMKLRELINRLEELSLNGLKDNMDVVIAVDGNTKFGISSAWIDRFGPSTYVRIEPKSITEFVDSI